MAKDIKIAGHEFKPWEVYGAAGVIVVAGVIYYRNKSAEATANANSSANPSAIDPVTGLPYSEDNTVDPLTGLTYLAEAEEYGSVAAAESAVSAANTAADTGSDVGDTGSSTSNVNPIPTTSDGSSYSTNQQWAAAAIAALEAMGYSSGDSTAAIGAYLGGLPLTTTQTTLVQTALAELGPPPVGTFSITTTPAGSASGGGGSTGTGTGTTGSTTVAVPNCTGQTTGQAHNTITAAGLHATAEAGQTDNLKCTGTSPAAGTQVAPGSNVAILATGTTVPDCNGLTAGQAHNVITAAGLNPVAATGQKATAICTGTNPAAGEIVNPGSSVTILT